MVFQPNKYQHHANFPLTDRQWPSRIIKRAPIWASTDLRDGNQSLVNPLTVEQKLTYFDLLCRLGFKEIEVAFPSASTTEWTLVRRLIEEHRIPDDVRIGVLTPARPELIDRTLESLAGVQQATLHLYHASSDFFMQHVLNMNRSELMKMARTSVEQIRNGCLRYTQSNIRLQYSPEHFTDSDLTWVLELCNQVSETWGIGPERPVIINLPATVERTTPNVYADQIEWMHCNLNQRNHIILSVHTHNDRGTAIAAAELGILAGADRVEGCLLGQGERTGNADLMTMALNFHTQGIDPKLDFSDLANVVDTLTGLTGMPVHPRHPYAGSLVFTAFSGSHQDAIQKGMQLEQAKSPWRIPYLPIDPEDLGLDNGGLIRTNSQSGKAGLIWVLEKNYGIFLPRPMAKSFSTWILNTLDDSQEWDAETLWDKLRQAYACDDTYLRHHLVSQPGLVGLTLHLRIQEQEHALHGQGCGPIEATIQAFEGMGYSLALQTYQEHTVKYPPHRGQLAEACCIVSCCAENRTEYGIGIDQDLGLASIKAVIAVWLRLCQSSPS